jgi:hypothetical protein
MIAKDLTFKVRFYWQVSRSDETPIPPNFPAALLLELSRSSDFPPALTETTRLPSLLTSELGEYLDPGHYFWRLRVGTHLVSPTRDFEIVREAK